MCLFRGKSGNKKYFKLLLSTSLVSPCPAAASLKSLKTMPYWPYVINLSLTSSYQKQTNYKEFISRKKVLKLNCGSRRTESRVEDPAICILCNSKSVYNNRISHNHWNFKFNRAKTTEKSLVQQQQNFVVKKKNGHTHTHLAHVVVMKSALKCGLYCLSFLFALK